MNISYASGLMALLASSKDEQFSRVRFLNRAGGTKSRHNRRYGTDGAFGARSKPLRTAEPMNDLRFMSRAQRVGYALHAALANRPR